MWFPPRIGTEERLEYDIKDLEHLGSLAISSNIHTNPQIKTQFSSTLSLIGTRPFYDEYVRLYNLIMSERRNVPEEAEDSFVRIPFK